jgi:hypothetical protein
MTSVAVLSKPPFSLKTLVKDSNCVLIQDPSAIWGGSDHLPRRNLLTYSEDFSNAVWLIWGATKTLGQSDVFGGTTGAIISGTGTDCLFYQSLSSSAFANLSLSFSFYVKQNSTPITASLVVSTNVGATINGSQSFTTSSEWQRVTLTFNTGTFVGNFFICVGGGGSLSSGESLIVCCPMLALASTIDQSYQRITDWVTEQYAWAATKNVPWLRRNRFLSTATLSTQTVSAVTATPLTVSFTGTGSITFSTAYSGSLVGTGASNRVTATFTPAAGNLVCTVTGTVTLAQCEVGSTATPYQEVGASWAATYTSLAIAAYPVSLYSDRAGTTATVGPDDPVGVLLDQSENLSGAVGGGRNLLTYSEDFSNAVWAKAETAAAYAVAVAPDGSNTASTLTENSTTNGHFIYRSAALPTVAGTYIFSVYAKAGSRNWLRFLIQGSASKTTWFNISNGTLGTVASGVTASIVSAGNNWYRCVIQTSDSGAVPTNYIYICSENADGGTSYAGNGSISTYLWGSQIQLASTTDQSYQKVTDTWWNGSVPGYHATAPSVAGSPTLRLDGNGKFYLDRDTTDDALAVTWPASFSTTAVQYVADQSTTTETTGITLNGATSYTTPQRPTGDYGRIIFKTPTSSAPKVKKYLGKKAGR